ncbi:PD40 domain-containing protein [Phytohabitans rumicis]|uniref:Calcium-binding protein n=1 Tax=Phytohabitans rumicis TaxID=1076125 RepID=A0A6V8KQH5_9ACTN|nr:PD40 domain-containing protein [Phytohabitans rumicis]GFJ87432.1 hypothetical protein Prum_010740 [Phytohabitans rumicis]
MSVSTAGVQGNEQVTISAVSGDGRYVAFSSYASNLVAGDVNGDIDVFVRDRRTRITTRISAVGTADDGRNSGGMSPAISGNGRYVAFTSGAPGLVPRDTNEMTDLFVRDRVAGTTVRANLSSTGVEANASTYNHTISTDGRYLAFTSTASNLVAGDTNGTVDVFVRDRLTRITTRASVSSRGRQGTNHDSATPAISANGRYVAFTSAASNLVPGDSNGTSDVFIRDRWARTTVRISVSNTERQAAGDTYLPAISANGRYVAFTSAASNLVPGDSNRVPDVFVRDRRAGTTTRISVSTSGAEGVTNSAVPVMSASGRYVAFLSSARNLVPDDTNDAWDVVVRDRRMGTTTRVSRSTTGVQANTASLAPAISADGRYVTFTTGASNLVPSDTNDAFDIFVHGPIH